MCATSLVCHINKHMNYNKIYSDLIESRQKLNRTKKDLIPYEKHHVLPKCFGGTDQKRNLVLLTPREHFISHWLLYKIHSGKAKAKMAFAFFRMCSNNPNQSRCISSRDYERAKQFVSESCKGENHPLYGRILTDDQKEQIRVRQSGVTNSMFGKEPWNKGKKLGPLTDDHKHKMSQSLKGTVFTEERIKNMSKGMQGIPKSEEHKEKIRQSRLGVRKPSDVVEKTAAKLRGRPQQQVTCPYCDKTGGLSCMKRWHFDNCRDIL